MKFLLAVLMSFIIIQAPVLARYVYSIPGTAASVVGTYAGVMIPISDTILVASTVDYGKNALGLFTLSIPATGIGGGTVSVFSGGDTFTGSIQALPNPDPSNLGVLGVLNATYDYNLYVPVSTNGTNTITTEAVTATANGNFDASVVNDPTSVGGNGVNLSGTSTVSITQGFVNAANGNPIEVEEVAFAIEGYEQSTSASSTTGT